MGGHFPQIVCETITSCQEASVIPPNGLRYNVARLRSYYQRVPLLFGVRQAATTIVGWVDTSTDALPSTKEGSLLLTGPCGKIFIAT